MEHHQPSTRDQHEHPDPEPIAQALLQERIEYLREAGFGAGSQRGPSGVVPGVTTLALSGGGFRATAFHVGAIRRLIETRVLASPGLNLIGVSGGSIALGLIATVALERGRPLYRWTMDDWHVLHERAHRLTSSNFRSFIVVRRGYARARGDHPVAHALRDHLSDARIGDFRDFVPSMLFAATDSASGRLTAIGYSNLVLPGSPLAGRSEADDLDIPLCQAVAASSAFPGFLPPVRIQRNGRRVALWDGGVTDNLGVSLALYSGRPDVAETVLISDAGGEQLGLDAGDEGVGPLTDRVRAGIRHPGETVGSMASRLFGRFKRPIDAITRSGRMTQRHLIETYPRDGRVWTSVWCIDPARWASTGWLQEDVRTWQYTKGPRGTVYGFRLQDALASVRTDLDALSEDVTGMLENHGYGQCAWALAAEPADRKPRDYQSTDMLMPHWDLEPNTGEDGLLKKLRGADRHTPLGHGWRKAVLELLHLSGRIHRGGG